MAANHPIASLPPLPRLPGIELSLLSEFIGYAVGTDGSVWSCRKTGPFVWWGHWRRLGACVHKQSGRQLVALGCSRYRRHRYVDVEVLRAFVGDCPRGHTIYHKDGDRTNTAVSNLCWRSKTDPGLVSHLSVQQLVVSAGGSPLESYVWLAGYFGYAIGTDGSVWNFGPMLHRGASLPTRVVSYPDPQGYPYVSLYVAGRRKRRHIHRLMGTQFLGPQPEGQETRHLDGNPGNYHLTNLVYGTPHDNYLDRIRHGTTNRGERHPLARLTVHDVHAIRRSKRTGVGVMELAAKYGVSHWTIYSILQGKTWKHV